MKTLEEIERLSPEELEQAASSSQVPVPAGLQGRIRQQLAAAEISAQAPVRRLPRGLIPALAAAAAATAFALLPHGGPKDSFDDPRLAYAEVEKAFQIISDKLSSGMDLTREATEIPQNLLDKIQSR